MKKGTQSDVALFAMSTTEQTLADKCIGMFQDGAYGANFGMSIYALRNKKITVRRPTDLDVAIHMAGRVFGSSSGGIEPIYQSQYQRIHTDRIIRNITNDIGRTLDTSALEQVQRQIDETQEYIDKIENRNYGPSSKEIAVDRIAKENPGIFDEMLRKMNESTEKKGSVSHGNQPNEK